MPLEFAAIFLPFAGLISLVVVWPRLLTKASTVRLVAEVVATLVIVLALFYGTVVALQWVDWWPRGPHL